MDSDSLKSPHSISLFHSTGPRPHWDPDIVATLDDDYEHCDSLDDDFVGVANAGNPNSGNQDEPHLPLR